MKNNFDLFWIKQAQKVYMRVLVKGNVQIYRFPLSTDSEISTIKMDVYIL